MSARGQAAKIGDQRDQILVGQIGEARHRRAELRAFVIEAVTNRMREIVV